MLKGFYRKYKPLEIITEEDVEEIHRSALDILKQTGVRIESKQALKDLEKHGCMIDHGLKRARFPEYIVEEAIRKSPSTFRIKARDPAKDLLISRDVVYFMHFPGMQTVDLDTWEPRDATRQEYYDMVTVLDALPNLHSITCYPYFGYQGIPPVMRTPEGVAIKIRNSTKVQQMCSSHDCDQFTIQMVKATGGEALLPIMGSAPLTWNEDQIRATYRAVESGFPILIIQGTVSGATGPATIAGTAAINIAHELSMLTFIQLLAPGSRVILQSVSHTQNMRSGDLAYGRIECALFEAVENQVARLYRIPKSNATPGFPSSKKIDFQTGYMKALNALSAAITGSNIILLHSGIFGEITAHPLEAILDDDIAGMVGRFVKGVTVNDETIALELIEETGPIPGHYLSTAHTRKWWQEEQYIPNSADELTYPEWIKSGKKDCIDHAKSRLEEILTNHNVSIPLNPSMEKEIGTILREAREYYRQKGQISDEEWVLYNDQVLKSPDYPFAL